MKALCGLDCAECSFREESGCKGCAETDGRPFGGDCVIGACCRDNVCKNGGKAFAGPCRTKEAAIAEFNALSIPGMPTVTELHMLPGRYVNLPYTLPGGQRIRVWADDRVYLVNQLHKAGSDRCFGLTADEAYLLVCEYGENGTDAEIIVYKKRHIGKAGGGQNASRFRLPAPL